MKLREFPGALALGLLASLIAHTALFGGEHQLGGAYQAAIFTMVSSAVGGLLVGFAALAWLGARHTADGSILASRLGQRLPGLAPLLATTALCFALCERLEPEHAARGLLPLVVALAVAAWLVRALAQVAIEALARAVIAIDRTPFAPRIPIRVHLAVPVVIVKPAPQLRRRFARPPPIANVRA
jgi:hypothetical protein